MTGRATVAALAVLAGCGSTRGTPPSAPTDLRVDEAVDPVGVRARPSFGWHAHDPDPGERQTGYQILVASTRAALDAGVGDRWDSGQVASDRVSWVTFAGAALPPGARSFWKVRTWDLAGNAGRWSAPASFVTGPLTNADWSTAQWIRLPERRRDDYVYFRKTFPLAPTAIAEAHVFISGTHKFELHVNGTLVGKGPSYHHPEHQYYNGFDVAPALNAGARNVVAVLAHWFGGGQGRPASEPGVIAKLEVTHVDGTTEVVVTDETWKVRRAEQWLDGMPSRNPAEGSGYVEAIDARLDVPGWDRIDHDDGAWPAAASLGVHPVAPYTGTLQPDLTRIRETVIAPVSIADRGPGRVVVDFGRVYAGVPRVRFGGGAPGTNIDLRGGFTLTDAGDVSDDPVHANQQTNLSYRAIAGRDAFTFQPMEYEGFRYLQVDGSPSVLDARSVAFIERHLDMDTGASSFTSSDPALDDVFEMLAGSLPVCAQEQFVDTPTREKGAFLMAAAPVSLVTMPLFGERVLTRKSIREFLTSMEDLWSGEGRINAVYPNDDGKRDIPDYTEKFVSWVWDYYLQSGDRELLRDAFPALRQIADYVDRSVDPRDGLVHRLPGGSGPYANGIVDWPESMRFGYDLTDTRTVIDALAWIVHDVVARVAEELGDGDGQAAHRARADAMRDAMNARLIDARGVYVDGLDADLVPSAHAGQQANVLPLAVGLVPLARRADVVRLIEQQKVSLGFETMRWLIEALGEADRGPQLLALYTDRTWPRNYATMRARGATMTWEQWDADTVPYASRSHAWGAVGLHGYVRYILGIRPLAPQLSQVEIRPLDFGAALTWVRGKIATSQGALEVRWSVRDGRHEMTVVLPTNMTATVCLPNRAGTRRVTVDGRARTATPDRNHLCVAGIGSGAHVVVRE